MKYIKGCTGKQKYNDDTSAEEYVSVLHSNGNIMFNSYSCRHCGAWHVGHLPKHMHHIIKGAFMSFPIPLANGTFISVGNRRAEVRGNQQLELPTSYLVTYLDERGGNEWISDSKIDADAEKAAE